MKKGKKTAIIVILIILSMILFYFAIWPLIQRYSVDKTCEETYGPGWKAIKTEDLPEDYFNKDDYQAAFVSWRCISGEEYNKIMKAKNK